ncbi:MAG: tetratricopeptide repeat protein [Treponema sp.]|nr:tetratricopeptide repeat protein [Treponema sp.]
MLQDKTRIRYGRHIYRLKTIRALIFGFLIIFIGAVVYFTVSRIRNGAVVNEKREILRIWNNEEYEQAYEISKNSLTEKPIDYFMLTTNGFAAYQIGISQINNQNTLFFLDESIRSLRKALLLKDAASDGRVYYVLGKAYSNKGNEYADLAIKYLETANNLSYEAHDIPEFLGLSYAACGDYRSSVEAFTRAFIDEKQPSDALLLSIARSYMAMEEYNMAIGYLQQCVDNSQDSQSVNISRFLLAEIYILSGDYDKTERQYMGILETSGENAEVHYQLGELYNLQGDTTRARSEWRIAYRQDPTHARARARLNI